MSAISVIIPVYNTEEYLREALDSVLSQTIAGELEVIAIDDGSKDGSGRILDEYSDRIRVIHKANEGQAAARNDGLDVATGEYVYFMDSDDWIEADTLETCLSVCRSENLDFVFFDAGSFGERAEALAPWFDYHRSHGFDKVQTGCETMTAMLRADKYRCSVCMSMFRKAFLDGAGIRFRKGIIHEDELFSALVYFNATRVRGIEREFYHRRWRGESTMTSTFSTRNVDGYLTVMDEAEKYVQSHPEAKEANRLLTNTILICLLYNGNSLPFSQKTRIARSVLSHPHAFKLKPFLRLFLAR